LKGWGTILPLKITFIAFPSLRRNRPAANWNHQFGRRLCGKAETSRRHKPGRRRFWLQASSWYRTPYCLPNDRPRTRIGYRPSLSQHNRRCVSLCRRLSSSHNLSRGCTRNIRPVDPPQDEIKIIDRRMTPIKATDFLFPIGVRGRSGKYALLISFLHFPNSIGDRGAPPKSYSISAGGISYSRLQSPGNQAQTRESLLACPLYFSRLIITGPQAPDFYYQLPLNQRPSLPMGSEASSR